MARLQLVSEKYLREGQYLSFSTIADSSHSLCCGAAK